MKHFILLFLLMLVNSCSTDKKTTTKKKYLRWVGDITINEKMDDEAFSLCNGENNVYQYFNTGKGFQYKGEKKTLVRKFDEEYRLIKGEDQNGMIRIRFIVNCEGKAGRFRVLEADNKYQPKKFDTKIVNQLLTITKGLTGWVPMEYQDKPIDYYLYLTFKMEEGAIKEILP
jgi:hypothetical protein